MDYIYDNAIVIISSHWTPSWWCF